MVLEMLGYSTVIASISDSECETDSEFMKTSQPAALKFMRIACHYHCVWMKLQYCLFITTCAEKFCGKDAAVSALQATRLVTITGISFWLAVHLYQRHAYPAADGTSVHRRSLCALTYVMYS